MAQLFGQNWTRRQLESYSNLAQLGGIKRYTLQDGFEREVEILEVGSGAGLRLGICPSRGMDIVWAKYHDINLCWRGDNGVMHPAFFEERNFGWVRGFPGGLITTCGLSSLGPPCEDQGEYYSIHDRFSYLPAVEYQAETLWQDNDDCVFQIRGSVRQTRLFGPNLRLDRNIKVFLGGNSIQVSDRITNDGFSAAPAVILYHCNFGFPLLAPGARIDVPSNGVRARDDEAAKGINQWDKVVEAESGFAEQVFFHDVQELGSTYAAVVNEQLNVRAKVEFNTAQLPYLTQWRMLGAGTFVTGLEPSNVPLASRATLREQNALPYLEPGASTDFDLRFVFEPIGQPV